MRADCIFLVAIGEWIGLNALQSVKVGKMSKLETFGVLETSKVLKSWLYLIEGQIQIKLISPLQK